MDGRRKTCRDMGHLAQPHLHQGAPDVRSDIDVVVAVADPLYLHASSSALQIFDASHMVGFDVPHVAHDMILRFMGVNFTAITDGSARIPSSVGSATKPLPVLEDASTPTPVSTKTPEQDKAMWEGTMHRCRRFLIASRKLTS